MQGEADRPGGKLPPSARQEQRRGRIVGHRRAAQADQVGVQRRSRARSRTDRPSRPRRSAMRSGPAPSGPHHPTGDAENLAWPGSLRTSRWCPGTDHMVELDRPSIGRMRRSAKPSIASSDPARAVEHRCPPGSRPRPASLPLAEGRSSRHCSRRRSDRPARPRRRWPRGHKIALPIDRHRGGDGSNDESTRNCAAASSRARASFTVTCFCACAGITRGRSS